MWCWRLNTGLHLFFAKMIKFKSRALYILDKHSTPKLNPSPKGAFYE